MKPTFVHYFEEIGIDHRPIVGGKGASLGELIRAGIRVPPGCVVTTAAFEHFLADFDADGTIRAAVAALGADDLATIERVSTDIRDWIKQASIPGELREAIAQAYRCISAEAADGPVAVRSSATSEDSAEASFAGLQDTYLWVRGEEALLDYVLQCWASLYSTESISYRRRLKLPENGLAMGVVIQRMVNARCAGVMFTRSPTTGDRSVVTLEASWGLGSAIVSGEVTPDKYVVNKVTGEIVKRTVSRKLRRHRPNPVGSGVIDEAVPDDLLDTPCLSQAEIERLAKIACDVERHYGSAQDIEWAIEDESADGDGMFLLQSRPETVWAGREAEPVARPKARAFDHVFAALGGGGGKK